MLDDDEFEPCGVVCHPIRAPFGEVASDVLGLEFSGRGDCQLVPTKRAKVLQDVATHRLIALRVAALRGKIHDEGFDGGVHVGFAEY